MPTMLPFEPPWPPPIFSTITSSCSLIFSIAFSPGTCAVTWILFFINCSRTAFVKPDAGFFCSTARLSITNPRPCGEPSNGSRSHNFSILRLYAMLFHLNFFLLLTIILPENSPANSPDNQFINLMISLQQILVELEILLSPANHGSLCAPVNLQFHTRHAIFVLHPDIDDRWYHVLHKCIR